MSRAVRTSVLLALVSLLALVGAGSAVAGSSSAHAAGSCHLSNYDYGHLGASYVTSLSVKGVSCGTGKSVVRAYHKCRSKHGWMGKCGHAAGYSCSRHIIDRSPAAYDAKVTCKRGGKRVVHTYQENK
jgi:hypothetical protein